MRSASNEIKCKSEGGESAMMLAHRNRTSYSVSSFLVQALDLKVQFSPLLIALALNRAPSRTSPSQPVFARLVATERIFSLISSDV
ncbi:MULTISPECIES: hypothetical protein [unclassified Novosphingobium]|uniref:hypothetical protein n=1 Tax=unclassified Novosphingobium TaxID=2644732 RepID=UPI00146D6EC4|nr:MULTISPECIES: hypothetical protein [unclassified Novosphingobium]NMN03853.1 hypothetical protein [Novosphingobium sp. SG919]NMN86157.1 hypothetical protein [Novosphingobium sp. SG916]